MIVWILNIAISLTTSLIGVLVGWIIAEPNRIPRWIALNKRTNWNGIWLLAWSPKLPNDNSWVLDKVKFTHKLGKLKIGVVESTEGYEWEALLSLKGSYLIGEWYSLKPNSPSRGSLQLKISNQGDVIYGLGTGPHVNEKLVVYKFIFSQSLSRIDDMKTEFSKRI